MRDQLLLDRIRAGDRAACERFWQNWRPRILSYLRNRTSEPEDVMQIVMLQAHKAIMRAEKYDAPVAPWLYVFAQHAAMNYNRRGQTPTRRWAVSLDEALEVPAPSRPVEDSLIAAEEVERALQWVEELNPTQRRVVGAFLDGKTLKEQQVLLARTESATKSVLQRARVRLQERRSLEAQRPAEAGRCGFPILPGGKS